MPPNQANISTIARALKETGITNPEDRRAFIRGKDLKEKVRGILENNPDLQEELAHSMGIGDDMIEHLHEVMEKDFQEPETLLRELIEFFRLHGNLALSAYTIINRMVKWIHVNNGYDRIKDLNLLFSPSSSKRKKFTNERKVLQEDLQESSEEIESTGGRLCFKMDMISGAKILLSFGDKNTPKNEVAKIRKLFKKTGLLQRVKEKLKHIETKYADHLTKLYNKHYIQSIIEKNVPYSVIFLDLDKFKEYNDTYGHDEGDILLKEIAKILQSSVRYNDRVCRNGWDEFVIFIDGCDAEKEIEKIKGRIQEKIYYFNLAKEQTARSHDAQHSAISITSGHALWEQDGTLEDIIRRADKEMFREKMEKWSEWGLYRIIDKVSKLSEEQQKEIVAGLIAIRPELARTLKELISSE